MRHAAQVQGVENRKPPLKAVDSVGLFGGPRLIQNAGIPSIIILPTRFAVVFLIDKDTPFTFATSIA